MSQPILSLVVPVYNVAPYLPQCLESIAALNPPACEIIVVDDGSTDNCPGILAEFAPRLPQMRVIRQENGGLSAARNTGLDMARGKYLAFVDSDDFIAPDTFRLPVVWSERDALDIVLFNGWYHHETRAPDRMIYPSISSSKIMSGREWIVEHPLGVEFLHYTPLNLYRRAFLEGSGLRFIPRRIHEDVVWTTQALLCAKRVAYDSTPYYFYRQPIRKPSNEQKQNWLEQIVSSSVSNARDIDITIEKHFIDGKLREILANQLVDGGLSVFHKLRKMPNQQAAAVTLYRLRRDGFLALLWRNAANGAQRRRIARHWLRSWLAGIGK